MVEDDKLSGSAENVIVRKCEKYEIVSSQS
jgi:hypothetical protein